MIFFTSCAQLSLYLLIPEISIFHLYLEDLISYSFVIVCVANVVLQNACERVIVGELYCDVPLGLYVIRGENVVLIGELVISSFFFMHLINLIKCFL